MTKILIMGTFDIPHLGHMKIFERAQKLGRVVVAVNKDDFTKRFKRQPIMTLEERMETLKHLRDVDEVVVNEGDEDCKPTILKVKPDFILHGSDWMGESLMKQMGIDKDFLAKENIEMVYLDYTEGISTSEIISRCQKRLGQ